MLGTHDERGRRISRLPEASIKAAGLLLPQDEGVRFISNHLHRITELGQFVEKTNLDLNGFKFFPADRAFSDSVEVVKFSIPGQRCLALNSFRPGVGINRDCRADRVHLACWAPEPGAALSFGHIARWFTPSRAFCKNALLDGTSRRGAKCCARKCCWCDNQT